MEKETENWVRKRMFYEKYGSQTFELAKKMWLQKKGKGNFIKRFWWNWSLYFNGSLIMAEIKPLQDKLIDGLIKLELSSKP